MANGILHFEEELVPFFPARALSTHNPKDSQTDPPIRGLPSSVRRLQANVVLMVCHSFLRGFPQMPSGHGKKSNLFWLVDFKGEPLGNWVSLNLDKPRVAGNVHGQNSLPIELRGCLPPKWPSQKVTKVQELRK